MTPGFDLTLLAASAPEASGDVTLLWWLIFLVAVVALLLLDLLVFHREAHRVGTKEAAVASAAWVGLGLLFAFVVWYGLGAEDAQLYLAGYLIEKSLSVDNLFVFVLIFSYFGVPNRYQHRVLFWGILGAFVFRGIFIALGATLLARFSWVAYIFGVFLIYTAYKLATHRGVDIHPADNPVLNLVRRFIPMTTDFQGQKMFIRRNEVAGGEAGVAARGSTLVATPLFAVLIVIETTDIIFAVDSIPAIFGVTRDPFLVFSSNAMALLGLRALYFLLADLVARFRYLHTGLAVILGVVGTKLIYEETVHYHDEGALAFLPDWFIVHIPAWGPLLVVAAILTVAIVASIRNPKPDEEVEQELEDAARADTPVGGDSQRPSTPSS